MAGTQPTQQDVADLKNELTQAQTQITNLKAQLDKQPSSNGKTLLESFFNSKLGFISKCLSGIGILTITTDDLKTFRENMKSNVFNLKEALEQLAGTVLETAEGLIEIITDAGKGAIAIVEKIQNGVAKIVKSSPTSAKVSGSTKNLQLTFSPRFQSVGFPASAGPFSGTWTATVQQTGTDMQGNSLYKITAYECEIAGVTLGPVALKSLQQSLDVERPSTFSVSPAVQVNGTLNSLWTSANWSSDDTSRVLGTTNFTGKVVGGTLTYSTDGEDYLFIKHFLPLAVVKPIIGVSPTVEAAVSVKAPAAGED